MSSLFFFFYIQVYIYFFIYIRFLELCLLIVKYFNNMAYRTKVYFSVQFVCDIIIYYAMEQRGKSEKKKFGNPIFFINPRQKFTTYAQMIIIIICPYLPSFICFYRLSGVSEHHVPRYFTQDAEVFGLHAGSGGVSPDKLGHIINLH